MLHPRTATYPVTRINSSGTWALIAPAQGGAFAQTQIVGERPARRATTRKGQNPETTERWSVGENTQITHCGSDSESYTKDSAQAQPSEPVLAGKRKQAFPPTVKEQPITGVFEAPIVQQPKVSPPLPPEPKRKRITFGTVSVPSSGHRAKEATTASAAPHQCQPRIQKVLLFQRTGNPALEPPHLKQDQGKSNQGTTKVLLLTPRLGGG